MTRVASLLISVLLLASATGMAQAPMAGVDAATISRIRGEAMTRSQAMETHWWLSEVYGPRATGTPAYQQGADWVMKKFAEWGLQNIHVERFPFGQGWTIERFSINQITPQTASLVGQPRRAPDERCGLGRGHEAARPCRARDTAASATSRCHRTGDAGVAAAVPLR